MWVKTQSGSVVNAKNSLYITQDVYDLYNVMADDRYILAKFGDEAMAKAVLNVLFTCTDKPNVSIEDIVKLIEAKNQESAGAWVEAANKVYSM